MRGAPLPPINRFNTALVLHDMQNDFIKDSLSKPEMVEVNIDDFIGYVMDSDEVARMLSSDKKDHSCPISFLKFRSENVH